MNYRNQRLLDLAREVTVCTGCGSTYMDGSIVAAHSNQLRDGKGRGIKAHDYRIAYLCPDCHYKLDQSMLSRQERLELWEEAHRKTIGWLFENGKI